LEKPIATSVATADEIAAAVDAGDVASMVFFTRRFVPPVAAWLGNVLAQGGWQCGRAEMASSFLASRDAAALTTWRDEMGRSVVAGPMRPDQRADGTGGRS
jgi:predicted dehydrogenase